MLAVAGEQSKLFLPERDALDDLWHGPLPSHMNFGELLGVEVVPLSQLSTFLADRYPRADTVHALAGAHERPVLCARRDRSSNT